MSSALNASREKARFGFTMKGMHTKRAVGRRAGEPTILV
jgi:hypothetical protein